MSDLEQLAAVLRTEFGKVATSGPVAALNVKDGLVALGWSPPAQLITSPDRERIDQLRALFADRVAAYKMSDFVSTHDALIAAVVYIEELERWVGLVPEDGDKQ